MIRAGPDPVWAGARGLAVLTGGLKRGVRPDGGTVSLACSEGRAWGPLVVGPRAVLEARAASTRGAPVAWAAGRGAGGRTVAAVQQAVGIGRMRVGTAAAASRLRDRHTGPEVPQGVPVVVVRATGAASIGRLPAMGGAIGAVRRRNRVLAIARETLGTNSGTGRPVEATRRRPRTMEARTGRDDWPSAAAAGSGGPHSARTTAGMRVREGAPAARTIGIETDGPAEPGTAGCRAVEAALATASSRAVEAVLGTASSRAVEAVLDTATRGAMAAALDTASSQSVAVAPRMGTGKVAAAVLRIGTGKATAEPTSTETEKVSREVPGTAGHKAPQGNGPTGTSSQVGEARGMDRRARARAGTNVRTPIALV